MQRNILDKIEKMITPILEKQDIELVEIEWGQRGKGGNLCIYIDRPEGITLKDCESVSYEISDLLDREDPIPHNYSLEVSSPGVERPLRKKADFERFTDHLINAETLEPVNGRKNFRGRLISASQENFLIRTENEEEYEIYYANLKKARLCYRQDNKI